MLSTKTKDKLPKMITIIYFLTKLWSTYVIFTYIRRYLGRKLISLRSTYLATYLWIIYLPTYLTIYGENIYLPMGYTPMSHPPMGYLCTTYLPTYLLTHVIM